jgi:anti-sigma factor RsiW
MNTNRTSPSAIRTPDSARAEHALDWNDRLQDWLDGELDGADLAAFEAHLAGCEICQQSVERLEQLDGLLVEATPQLSLDENFDRRLMERIQTSDEAVNEKGRAEARRRVEQELQQQLGELRRGWKRTLAFVIPGIVAGIAIAFALASWLDSSGLTGTLVAEGTAELGNGSADFIRLGVISIVGTALGTLVAPWLARLSE